MGSRPGHSAPRHRMLSFSGCRIRMASRACGELGFSPGELCMKTITLCVKGSPSAHACDSVLTGTDILLAASLCPSREQNKWTAAGGWSTAFAVSRVMTKNPTTVPQILQSASFGGVLGLALPLAAARLQDTRLVQKLRSRRKNPTEGHQLQP